MGANMYYPHKSRSRSLSALSSACLSDDLTRNLTNRLEAERKAQDVLLSLSPSGHFTLTLGQTTIDFPSREQAELQAEAFESVGITFERKY